MALVSSVSNFNISKVEKMLFSGLSFTSSIIKALLCLHMRSEDPDADE